MPKKYTAHRHLQNKTAKAAGDMIGTVAVDLGQITRKLSKEFNINLSQFPSYLAALNAIRKYEGKVREYFNNQ